MYSREGRVRGERERERNVDLLLVTVLNIKI